MLKGLIIASMILLSPVRVDDVYLTTNDVVDVWFETDFGDEYYVIEIDSQNQTIEFY